MSGREPDLRLITIIVACATFIAQLDVSLVLIALPAIAASFDVQPVDVSIGVTAYVLSQAVLLPGTEWVASRFGARRVFSCALAGFALTSALCALSGSVESFTAARVLQGAAAALVNSIGRIILVQSTPKSELVRIMSIITIPILLAPSLGPPLGGFIVTHLSWEWVFLVNVPLALAGIPLALRVVPRTDRGARRPFDFTGFLVAGIALTLLLSALDGIGAGRLSWQAACAMLAAGMLFGFWTIRHARRHPYPVLSLEPAGIRTFWVATAGGGLLARVSIRALPFVLTLMFQTALGLDAFWSGVLLFALSGGDLVLKFVVPPVLRRFGFRNLLIATAVLSAASIAACAAFSPSTPLWAIFVVLLASGMVRSFLFTGLSTLALADVPAPQLGAASVLWNVFLQVTNALAISVSTILLSASARVLGEPGASPALIDFRNTLIALAAIGALSTFSFVRLARDAGVNVSGWRPPAASGKQSEGTHPGGRARRQRA